MLLRGQNVDLLDQISKHPNRAPRSTPSSATTSPTAATRSRPRRSSSDIKAPVFIAGAWQDEQTGGHWAEHAQPLRADHARCAPSGQNGVHTESLDPPVLRRADRVPRLLRRRTKVPTIPPSVRASAPGDLGRRSPASPGCTLPPDRFTRRQTSRSALAAVRGRAAGAHQLGDGQRAPAPSPGAPVPTRRRRGTRRGRSRASRATTWYLQPGGAPRHRSRRGARGAPARPLPAATRPPARARATPGGRRHLGARPRPTTGSRSSTAKSLSYISSPLHADRLDGRAPAASTSGCRRPQPDATCR